MTYFILGLIMGACVGAVIFGLCVVNKEEKMNETEMLRYMIDVYDKKLKEVLPEDEYCEFAVNTAKEAFRHELDGMADGDFKRFCLDNFDKITEVEE